MPFNIDEKIKKKQHKIKVLLLEYSIICILARSKFPFYGKEILANLAKNEIPSHEGTIYPLLSKMRRDKILEYNYEESDIGPPRKYYYVTDLGKKYHAKLKYFLRGIST